MIAKIVALMMVVSFFMSKYRQVELGSDLAYRASGGIHPFRLAKPLKLL